MKKTLYEITGEALAIYEQVEEQEGELTQELEEALIINESELQSKGIAYLEVIKERAALINTIDLEIKRLQAKKKANVNLKSRLEENLLLAQKTYGDFEIGLTTITTRASKSVHVEDVNSLPNHYKTVKIVESADKKLIKEALEAGVDIAGCSILENKNLRIK